MWKMTEVSVLRVEKWRGDAAMLYRFNYLYLTSHLHIDIAPRRILPFTVFVSRKRCRDYISTPHQDGRGLGVMERSLLLQVLRLRGDDVAMIITSGKTGLDIVLLFSRGSRYLSPLRTLK